MLPEASLDRPGRGHQGHVDAALIDGQICIYVPWVVRAWLGVGAAG